MNDLPQVAIVITGNKNTNISSFAFKQLLLDMLIVIALKMHYIYKIRSLVLCLHNSNTSKLVYRSDQNYCIEVKKIANNRK